ARRHRWTSAAGCPACPARGSVRSRARPCRSSVTPAAPRCCATTSTEGDHGPPAPGRHDAPALGAPGHRTTWRAPDDAWGVNGCTGPSPGTEGLHATYVG